MTCSKRTPLLLFVHSLILSLSLSTDLSAARIFPSGITVYPRNLTAEQCLTPLLSRFTFSFNFFSIKLVNDSSTRSPAFLLLTKILQSSAYRQKCSPLFSSSLSSSSRTILDNNGDSGLPWGVPAV